MLNQVKLLQQLFKEVMELHLRILIEYLNSQQKQEMM
jgi:hypothetical protein